MKQEIVTAGRRAASLQTGASPTSSSVLARARGRGELDQPPATTSTATPPALHQDRLLHGNSTSQSPGECAACVVGATCAEPGQPLPPAFPVISVHRCPAVRPARHHHRPGLLLHRAPAPHLRPQREERDRPSVLSCRPTQQQYYLHLNSVQCLT